jgi:endo-1,4-beta-xylanase
MLTESMDWITKKNGDGGKYGKLDKTKFAAAGQSCGGMEAMTVSGDPRVKLTGMFNSGLFGSSASTPSLAKLNHPIAYFLGGTGDIAYQNVSLY